MIYDRYVFESTHRDLAHKFLSVVTNMGIPLENIYIVDDGIDYSQIEFLCDRSARLSAEYVYRRFCGMEKLYLMDADHADSYVVELTSRDGYVIF